MKITIAYQEHERKEANEDAEILKQRHICNGDKVKARESKEHDPFFHTYLEIKEKTHK